MRSDRHTYIYMYNIYYGLCCAYIFTNRVSVGSLTYIQSVRRISLYIIYIILYCSYILYTLYIGNLSYMINYCVTYVHTCIFIYAFIVCVYLLLIYIWYNIMNIYDVIGSTSRISWWFIIGLRIWLLRQRCIIIEYEYTSYIKYTHIENPSCLLSKCSDIVYHVFFFCFTRIDSE